MVPSNERRTHDNFKNISQSRRENWLHPTVADRRSDSCFDCGISGAWLHVTGAKPLKIKKLAHDHPMLFIPLKAKEQIVDTCKA
jgi:hypothetical protein